MTLRPTKSSINPQELSTLKTLSKTKLSQLVLTRVSQSRFLASRPHSRTNRPIPSLSRRSTSSAGSFTTLLTRFRMVFMLSLSAPTRATLAYRTTLRHAQVASKRSLARKQDCLTCSWVLASANVTSAVTLTLKRTRANCAVASALLVKAHLKTVYFVAGKATHFCSAMSASAPVLLGTWTILRRIGAKNA